MEYFFCSTCEFPKFVIERLVFSKSAYNPIHFFIKKAELSKQEAIEFISNFDKPEINQVIKDKILERINGYSYGSQGKVNTSIKNGFEGEIENIENIVNTVMLNNKLNSSTKNAMLIKRTLFYNSLSNQSPILESVFQTEHKCIIEAFSNLKSEHLIKNQEYYLNMLKLLPFDKLDSSSLNTLRKVICFVDDVFYNSYL